MKLMVIDGNSIVNRAFYGVHMLTTRDGRPTNAVFGFLNILHKLLEDNAPDGLCVTFDLKAPTFRHLAYEGYKATRKGMPEELAAQMPVLKRVLDALNVPRYELEGWEADDLIGTIAGRCRQAGWSCTAVTGDKDSLQLVTEDTHVLLVSTRMGQTTTREVTPDSFREEYGFDPIHMIDLKALMGDASDNIPGVKGIGEKTALALVRQYGSVERLYGQMPDILMEPGVPAKPGVVKKLEEGREQARMSYELATIHCDAPIDFTPEDALRREPDREALYQLFLDLEFTKLIEKYGLRPGPAGGPAAEVPVSDRPLDVTEVTGPAQLDEIAGKWESADCVAVLPLPGLDGVAVCLREEGRAVLYDIRAARYEGDYRALLERLFCAGVRKAAHGVKELCRALLDEGLSTEGFVFDTEIAAYLLDPTAGSYELRRLGMQYFKRDGETSVAYRAENAFTALSDETRARTEWYEDAVLITDLRGELGHRLDELGMTALLTDLELPLCPVLAGMEREGFLVDRKALTQFGAMLTGRMEELERAIYELAGHEFNINSTQQFGRVLFEELGLPPVKKTKTGYSTSAEVLEKLRWQHPIVERVLEYRQLAKLNSTYVEGLGKVIGPDGRVHTTFQNTVTATGRLSSTEPNLQNIPVRTELGAEMRRMFMAAPGRVLVDADYSQIELRLLAHIAGDEAMREAFRTGADIHTITASQVLGVPPEQVTRQQRSSAKAVNFGIVYGISPFSLSQDIHVTVAEAKEYMQRYFDTYAGVARYQKEVVERAKADGYVSTLMGRRRWLPELHSSNFNQRSFGERVALNMPIQGTAADIIKLAMIRVDRRLRAEGLAARLILQVHDELIVECPEEEGGRVAQLLEEEMEGVVSLSVPLLAEAKQGRSWADAH